MPSAAMEGKTIPDVNFKVFQGGKWRDWRIRDMCANKTTVFFGLPGAFTPTCSTSHLPRYEELFELFQRIGVDDVYCVSVNDTFVMNSWAEINALRHVKMLPDGNGTFTEQMGLLVDKSKIGFGKRSWRYSMLVKDNQIQKMFVEPQEGSDPYGISDADTMMKYIDPGAVAPPRIVILSKKGCTRCLKIRLLLESKDLKFVELPLEDSVRVYTVSAISGKQSVPQVWVNGKHLGGAEAVERWISSF
eukprot:Gregarina_sp_Poly_1__2701@NODE_1743_length_3425_cov_455_697439_g666_i2_p1_GENE_NODE_1743_length_3425_cov_455_697439_g666_i2NODE_1743_length_3425_cov_455_697439_g666_i2_p1_ORF_typecomplete_len246_score28_88Redoxin/PF08534_10/3e26Glutaredoxin/PF00462_24/1_1e04Glutaredoxin/PF00462_24/2_4e07_NODE_1743_length_3425_cov_455_697439_g666_i2206943